MLPNNENDTCTRRNLLICDPTCVLPYGHAIPAMHHFETLLALRFENTYQLCSKALPDDIREKNGFFPAFTYFYNKYIRIFGDDDAQRHVAEHGSYDHSLADPFLNISIADAEAVLDEFDCTSDDVIYFPGADFYGPIGFIGACAKRTADRRPKIMIRLIGVLETASAYYSDPLQALLDKINGAQANGIDVTVSAETPAYADHVSRRAKLRVKVTPYPETSQISPLQRAESFNVLCAGSARLDKGFHHLATILGNVPQDPNHPVILTTQTLPLDGSEMWDHYTSQLYAMRRVVLLDSVISVEKMNALYKASHIVLLPYAQDVYRLRGSAVMMEAASVGRLCLTMDGTAFADQVRYYGLGDVVPTLADIPKAIERLRDTPLEELEWRSVQAHYRFFSDVAATYDAWFNG